MYNFITFSKSWIRLFSRLKFSLFCSKVTDQSIDTMNSRNCVQSYNAHYHLHRVIFNRLKRETKAEQQLICFELVGSSWNHQDSYVWSVRLWRTSHKLGPNTQLLKVYSEANISTITLLLYLTNKHQVFQEIRCKNVIISDYINRSTSQHAIDINRGKKEQA